MKKILFLSLCVSLFSCAEKKVSITDFSWIEGKWEGSIDGMSYFEEWQPLQGNSLQGQGGAIETDSVVDTVFSEKIKIEQRGEDVIYTANVEESDEAVDFKFTGYKNDSIVFENPKHDFPQRIVYFRHPDNKLYASIDGLNAGKYERIEFSYQKTK